MSKLLTTTPLIALALGSLVACNRARGDSDLDDVETATDSMTLSQAEGSLLSSSLEGSETASGVAPATPEGAAAYIAGHAPQRFSPAGCATGTANGAQVTLAFHNCVGPRGLRQVDGTATLTVSAGNAGAIVVTAKASDFQIGHSTFDIDSVATYSVAGSMASIAVTTHSSGVGPFGRDITHDGQYTISWTQTCVAIDGAWSTEVGAAGRSTTVDVMGCKDECPTGTITRNTFDKRVITLTFDGTSTGRWSSSAGRSGTFSMLCGL